MIDIAACAGYYSILNAPRQTLLQTSTLHIASQWYEKGSNLYVWALLLWCHLKKQPCQVSMHSGYFWLAALSYAVLEPKSSYVTRLQLTGSY